MRLVSLVFGLACVACQRPTVRSAAPSTSAVRDAEVSQRSLAAAAPDSGATDGIRVSAFDCEKILDLPGLAPSSGAEAQDRGSAAGGVAGPADRTGTSAISGARS